MLVLVELMPVGSRSRSWWLHCHIFSGSNPSAFLYSPLWLAGSGRSVGTGGGRLLSSQEYVLSSSG